MDETAEQQSKIVLETSGVVNGVDTSSSSAERLNRLRAFLEAVEDADMKFYPTLKHEEGERRIATRAWAASGGILPYSEGPYDLKLFRPPSLSRGIPERKWTFEDFPVPLDRVTQWCVVDLDNDLLALARWDMGGNGYVDVSVIVALPHPLIFWNSTTIVTGQPPFISFPYPQERALTHKQRALPLSCGINSSETSNCMMI